MTQMTGVTVIAVTQLNDNEINTTWNRERQNSPVASSDRPIAPNAMIATAVAPSSGIAVCSTTSIAASSVFCPP